MKKRAVASKILAGMLDLATVIRFGPRAEVESILKPINFVGRSVEQVEEYIAQEVAPKLKKYQDVLGEKAELSV